jgi:hypothetical protein
MPSLLILMIVLGLGFALWSAARAAAERAEDVGRDACRVAGVQWLDQTVHASGLRLARGEDGRLGFLRSFRFEYSQDGSDRHVGRLVLRGQKLVGFSGPMRGTGTVPIQGHAVAPEAGIPAEYRHLDGPQDPGRSGVDHDRP